MWSYEHFRLRYVGKVVCTETSAYCVGANFIGVKVYIMGFPVGERFCLLVGIPYPFRSLFSDKPFAGIHSFACIRSECVLVVALPSASVGEVKRLQIWLMILSLQMPSGEHPLTQQGKLDPV